MDNEQLKNIIEGALFAAEKPLSIKRLQALFEQEQQPEVADLKTAITELQQCYEQRGIQLVELASGFCFRVVPDVAKYLAGLWAEKPSRYSRALLETLAIIAYRQPMTRAEIEDIRGVAVSSNIIKSLQEREWIRVVGHKEVPGKPALYATTRDFLDYFGLKNLNQLPPLSELENLDEVQLSLDIEPKVEAEVSAETDAEVESEIDLVNETEANNGTSTETNVEIETLDKDSEANAAISEATDADSGDVEIEEQEQPIA